MPDGMAAVMATSSGCSSASAASPSPKTWVHAGGPLAFFRASPVTGSYAASPCHFSWFDSAKREALSLLGHHVDHPGARHAAHEAQRIAELGEIVPVERAEIAEAELLEEHARREEILDALLDVLREIHHPLAEDPRAARRSSS